MKQRILYEQLEKEKRKLGNLVDEALKNGIPLPQDEAVMAQTLKVDVLVVRLQKAYERRKEKGRKQQKENRKQQER